MKVKPFLKDLTNTDSSELKNPKKKKNYESKS